MTIELATVIYIASCITVIGGAIAVLVKAKNALLAPLKEINDKLDEHEVFLTNDRVRLDKIDGVLDVLIDSTDMLIKSHRTVLRHLEDGNHSGEIKREIKELDDWLVEKKVKGER